MYFYIYIPLCGVYFKEKETVVKTTVSLYRNNKKIIRWYWFWIFLGVCARFRPGKSSSTAWHVE